MNDNHRRLEDHRQRHEQARSKTGVQLALALAGFVLGLASVVLGVLRLAGVWR